MIFHDWMYLVIVCILGAFSPGPSLMVILSITSSFGRESGIFASLGHGFAVFIYALISATGLSVLINANENLMIYIQILGAAFLLYLALRIYISLFFFEKKFSEPDQNVKLGNHFRDGFLLAILNPKIAAFFLALFSQFLESDQTLLVHLLMAAIAGIIDTFAYIFVVFWASTAIIQKFILKNKKLIDLVFASILSFLSLSLFVNSIGYI